MPLQLKFSFSNYIQSSSLISNLRLFFFHIVPFSFYKSLKFVFEFRICSKRILGNLICDVKMTYNIFSVIRFLTRIHRIMSKIVESSSEEDDSLKSVIIESSVDSKHTIQVSSTSCESGEGEYENVLPYQFEPEFGEGEHKMGYESHDEAQMEEGNKERLEDLHFYNTYYYLSYISLYERCNTDIESN